MRRGKRLDGMRVIGAIMACAVSLALFGGTASSASAAFGISGFEVSSNILGSPSRQAGAHPDLRTVIDLNKVNSAQVDGTVKDLKVDLPPGFVGNAANFPTCPPSKFVYPFFEFFCPAGSVVGYGFAKPTFRSPIYNLEHGPDSPALFGFYALNVPVYIEPTVRPGDYGISAASVRTSFAEPVFGAEITLWGVPADPSHDALRGGPSPSAPVPFLTSPTSCPESAATFTATADSWQEPERLSSASTSVGSEGTPFRMSGCEKLGFNPSAEMASTSRAARSPSGLEVDIKVPQNEAPNGLATADVKKTVVTLPEGFAINPAAAVGQGGCSEAQIGIGSNDPPTCPVASRIGTVKIKTPLLKEELEGDVVLARQKENPFGSLIAMYLAVKGPGFYLKLPGKVELDQQTGRVVTTFDNTPQLPFEELKFVLSGNVNAPLVAPSTCGTYQGRIEMTSWASPKAVLLQSPMKITEGCTGGGFSPGFKAGTKDPTGGSFSPFNLQVTRNETESNLSRIQATLPPGLLAKLSGVPLCGDVQAVTGACPAASQVGTTTVGAGSGLSPVFVPEPGKTPTAVFLAGPYKGAPYSLVVKVPAQAGPFDLGTVVVRNALRIDPITTQVTTESDPLPQILEGIPVTYRDVRVEINRPEFTVNPTNCSQFQVTSVLTSATGQTASPKAPFAAANCEALGLAPKLAVKFSGAPTRRGGHPKLTATLTTKKGDANLKRVQVTLPKTEFLENAHIKTVCTRVQYAADQCPAKSIYGHAKAWSPLLDKPLEGPVYLRSSNHTLPDLVASLDGQIHVDLDGRIDSVHRRIRNTFETVPDAPVTKFVLTMQGGGKGLLVNNTNLCKAKPTANVKFGGQNGKAEETNPLVSVGGCGKGKKSAGKK